jgi:flagellar hook-basal body complex protein FliE
MPTEYISALSRINETPQIFNAPEVTKVSENMAVENPFKSFFDAAMDAVKETNEYQVAADNLQVALATGQTDDILSVLMAQSKAYDTLNFTVQVTNKIIESYREIMRMQI